MRSRISSICSKLEPEEYRVKRGGPSAPQDRCHGRQDFFENLVKLQAMALAFKTLLSLAPLLAVLFSILKAFGVHNRMEPALSEALAPLGEKGEEITAILIGFVDKMSAGALGSIGLGHLFVTVLSLMDSIEECVQPHLARAGAAQAGAQVQRLFERYSRRPGVGVRRADDHRDPAKQRLREARCWRSNPSAR